MTSLSSREGTLLAAWERERRVAVTTRDIADLVGPDAADDVARRLARKGALQRIARGRYLIRPLRQQAKPTVPSTPVAAALLLLGQPYYLGGLWAVSFHRLSEQSYASVVDAFVPRRLADRRVGPGRVRFHQVRQALLDYGVMTTQVEGLPVRVSDVERTLLDAIDRPRAFDGTDAAVERLKRNLEKADVDRLVAYAARGSRTSTCQRLGVILERHGVARSRLKAIAMKVRRSSSVPSMLPGSPRAGSVNTRWSIVENDG